MLWKDKLEAKIIVNEGNILLIHFHNSKDQVSWFLMNIYAPNSKNGRKVFWSRLCELFANLKDPKGIIMGDFNTPLRVTKKLGGHPPNLESTQDLANMINDLALVDVE